MPDENKHSERLAIVETEVKNLKGAVEVGFAELKVDVKGISDKFDCLDKKYVTRREFSPVKTITFGIVGAAGLAVLGGLIALVIK